MALISPTGNFLRVEDIRVGKNLIQFFAREYSDMSKPPISDSTYVTKYDIDGKNPYVHAYDYLVATDYSGYVSDNLPMTEPAIQEVILVAEEVVQEPTKKLRNRKAK